MQITKILTCSLLSILILLQASHHAAADDIVVIGTRPVVDGSGTGLGSEELKRMMQSIQLDQMNRAAAEAAAAAGRQATAQKQQECSARRAGINGALARCNWRAEDNRAKAIASCPLETEFTTSLAGMITVVSRPQATCIMNANAKLQSQLAGCKAWEADTLAKLPVYCY